LIKNKSKPPFTNGTYIKPSNVLAVLPEDTKQSLKLS